MPFQYRARKADDWDKRANQQGGDFQGFITDEYRVYQVRKGENWIRILPPTWDDPTHFGFEVYVHYSIGPEKAAVLCLAKQPHPTEGTVGPCPICEARARAAKVGDTELEDELKFNRRVMVWVLDRKEEEKGPLIWPMSWTMDRDIVKQARDRRTGEILLIDHPDDGYDVMFDKDGEGIKTKYTGIQLARRPSSVDAQHLDFIEGAPLPYVLRWRDYDEVKKLYDASGMEAPPRSRDDPPRRTPPDDPPSRRAPPDDPAPRRDPPPRRDAPQADRRAADEDSLRRDEEALRDPPPRRAPPPADPPPRDAAPERREAPSEGAISSAQAKAAALRERFAKK